MRWNGNLSIRRVYLRGLQNTLFRNNDRYNNIGRYHINKYLGTTIINMSDIGNNIGSDKNIDKKLNKSNKELKNTHKMTIYKELSKARLSALVVCTTGAGFMIAGPPFDWLVMSGTCIGTALCAASANTFNQVIEINYDKTMNRTKARPLPSGRVTKREAILWGLVSATAGGALLFTSSNPLVTALGVGNIALYAGVYTALKRRTELNTWVGSVVGAIPPVMGYLAAIDGNYINMFDGEALSLASLLFLWQFPHFFALSYLHREDYSRGGFQMVACNESSGIRSANLIWEYSVALSMLPTAIWVTNVASSMVIVESIPVNMYLLYLAHKFKSEGGQTNGNAKRVFLYSLIYLPLLMFSIILHSKNWDKDESKKRIINEDGVTINVIEEYDFFQTHVRLMRDELKKMCVHELARPNQKIVSKEDILCPKTMVDTTVDKAKGLLIGQAHVNVNGSKASSK